MASVLLLSSSLFVKPSYSLATQRTECCAITLPDSCGSKTWHLADGASFDPGLDVNGTRPNTLLALTPPKFD